jgi:GT2 family glycosyltransferase
MEKKQQISFIIVNHKSDQFLEKCLKSIRNKFSDSKKEIIVVNNSDYSSGFSDNLKIIRSSNFGFGSACNLGAKESLGDILCFLNPDTGIISNDFPKIISEFENNPKLGIIGPGLVDENGSVQDWSAGKEISLLDIIGNNLGFQRSRKIWTSEKKVECAWVSGACLFIRKELFEKLNGFDEKFFLYFEDIDLCKRALNSDYQVLYYPEFAIKHLGGKSFGSKKEQKKHYYSSQDYYFQKHFGKIRYFLLKIIRGLIV